MSKASSMTGIGGSQTSRDMSKEMIPLLYAHINVLEDQQKNTSLTISSLKKMVEQLAFCHDVSLDMIKESTSSIVDMSIKKIKPPQGKLAGKKSSGITKPTTMPPSCDSDCKSSTSPDGTTQQVNSERKCSGPKKKVRVAHNPSIIGRAENLKLKLTKNQDPAMHYKSECGTIQLDAQRDFIQVKKFPDGSVKGRVKYRKGIDAKSGYNHKPGSKQLTSFQPPSTVIISPSSASVIAGFPGSPPKCPPNPFSSGCSTC